MRSVRCAVALSFVALTCCHSPRASNETPAEDVAAIPSASSAVRLDRDAAPATPVAIEYPPIDAPLNAPCGDPRVVLAVRRQYDRSGRIWVQQALVAHPEFHVVEARARAPFEIDLYETIYGLKSFAPKPPGRPSFDEAVIARCADNDTCNRLAAMFQAVSPSDHPRVVCGVPQQTTGGFARVRELSPSRRALPDASAPLVGHCARLHACMARAQRTIAIDATCTHIDEARLRACTGRTDCDEVTTCAAQALAVAK